MITFASADNIRMLKESVCIKYYYIDQKTPEQIIWKCRKVARVTGRSIDWRYSQSCWYVLPSSFVNCCPSNLLSGSTLPPSLPSPPFPCVNKYTVVTVHTRIQCVMGGGGRVYGEADKH
jgi:hypothetical protein